MKTEAFKPSAADQAAVRAALDCGCKIDTSAISFFGKKRDGQHNDINTPTVNNTQKETYARSHKDATSERTLPKQTTINDEENEIVC